MGPPSTIPSFLCSNSRLLKGDANPPTQPCISIPPPPTGPIITTPAPPKQTKQQCIQSVLQNKFGNFIANKVIPEFSLYSLSSLSSALSFLKGSGLSLVAKGVLVGGPAAYGKILTATGQNLAGYPGLAAASADALEAGAYVTATAATIGTILAVTLTGVTVLATDADYEARQQCQNVP